MNGGQKNLILIYTAHILHNVRFSKTHFYEDDTQLTYAFNPKQTNFAVEYIDRLQQN